MSDEHKAALAEGRRIGKVVRDYLDALSERTAPAKRGRRRTPESIQKRLEAVAEAMGSADPLKRLQLTQEQLDLESELADLTDGPGGVSDAEFEVLEQAFIKDALAYANAKGIGYSAWRRLGVRRAVLRAAGVAK